MIEVTEFENIKLYKLPRIILGKTFFKVYVYQIGNTLIDTGYPKIGSKFINYFDNQRIDTIILTHHHEDHSGNAYLFAQKFDPEIYIHPFGREKIEKGFHQQMYRKFFWGKIKKCKTKAIKDIFYLNDSSTLKTIYTPGHSEDMISLFYENKGILFSSDLFIKPNPLFMMLEEDVFVLINSIKKVLELDFDILLCSHNPQLKKGKEALRKKLNYLTELHQKVWDLYLKGYPPSYINKKLFNKIHLTEIISLGHYSSKNLVKLLLRKRTI